ncbi:prephenate dehydrogenase [Tautonia plasticadhaerens]|uniref:Prephenate dehydrogenase n=1 Tax=Tautonia plasticadhaerens TaxID=2527974 RepID=A0A518H9E0_9BACT|nr:prephenate dehydrogenase/arogenate dehydrogenase family protein [Tautonia plasticadhaerens]QDV37472.1 prephenate dehydrogenase [Tautonia plasticadhaerens]
MQRYGTVAIVGVGLIGGSIGMAIRARGLADRVIGIGRDTDRLDEARGLGAIDEGTTDPEGALDGAEVVVVCTPTDRIAADVCRFAASSHPDVLITDVGSTKRRIVEAVEADDRARGVFVAAHPLAGSERRGAAAARSDLLDGRVCVLTPTDRTPIDRRDRAARFWSSIGGRVVMLDPDAHDSALARTSHLPHVAAAALALSVPAGTIELAAGAYRDGTRVAASDPDLWVAIFRENPEHLIAALDEYRRHLDRFREALTDDDPGELRSLWSRARALRSRFREPGSR